MNGVGRSFVLVALAIVPACGLGARGTGTTESIEAADASAVDANATPDDEGDDASSAVDATIDAPVTDASLDATPDADAAIDAGVDAALDAGSDSGFSGPYDCNGAGVTDCNAACAGEPVACVFCKKGSGAPKGFCRAALADCANAPASYRRCL